MLHVNYAKWNQTPQDLRDLSLYEEHPRTRERFLALYDIATGKNATQVSHETGRNNKTVMDWVHKYNEEGADRLFYKRTGGRLPLFVKKSDKV
jgi:transposase